ncbi:MAG TPA: phosphatase PAP2 family protein [Thermomicrobiales bacterium]|nr:phosphatase PAP2 family protein [Thermomicrobiales bacterium]
MEQEGYEATAALSPRRTIGEVLLIVGVMVLYYLTRGVAIGRADDAVANARGLVALEQRFDLFREPAIQAWFLHSHAAIHAMDWVYTYLHLPVLVAFAVWLYLRHQAWYAPFRNAFLVSAACALVVYALFPVAPPRLMPEYGFVDTLAVYSAISYELHTIRLFYNPYAAMPSLHVGWSLLAGIGFFWLGRNALLRLAGILLPLLMLCAVVITGNHFFLDALGGVCAVGAGFLVGFWTRLVDLWRSWRPAPSRTSY